jgi:HSP20 family molecular chaperone IbpA
MKEKKSFFERLTGSVNVDEYEPEEEHEGEAAKAHHQTPVKTNGWLDDESGSVGQLTVDVYQTPSEIIIKTMVAGVKRDDLDISITRDMVTIKGSREGDKTVNEADYFHKELYWGGFERTILLPHEIEVEGVEATENQGLLTIRLPKIDKDRSTKVRVKAA